MLASAHKTESNEKVQVTYQYIYKCSFLKYKTLRRTKVFNFWTL